MTTKFKKSFSPMLICWNDIKIHLGFEDSYFVPPPINNNCEDQKSFLHLVQNLFVIGKIALDNDFQSGFCTQLPSSTSPQDILHLEIRHNLGSPIPINRDRNFYSAFRT